MNYAYLLNRNGDVLRVLNHPNANFEFESILEILCKYGDSFDKALVDNYSQTPSEDLKSTILSIYDNKWCKVREWENCTLVTFRIASTDLYNWYPVIKNYLLDNLSYKHTRITVESDKRTGVRRTFWNEISYQDAVSPEFETILAVTNYH